MKPAEHLAAQSRETATVEIPDSPLSRHDLEVIRLALVRARAAGLTPTEVIVSSRRVRHGLRAFGLPVSLNDGLDLNEGLLVVEGHESIAFAFEEDE